MSEDVDLLVLGERVALGVLRRDLLPLYQTWLNELEVRRGTGIWSVETPEAQEAWYDERARATGRVSFTAYDRRDVTPIGVTSLLGIDPMARTAELGIWMGRRRGAGLGTEATRLTVDWGFTILGLHNIVLTVYSWNTAAIRAYERAGFRTFARRRQSGFCMGRRCDDVYMDILASEFTGSVLASRQSAICRESPSIRTR